MTNEEIVRHYKQAAKKRADIQTLADLNATTTKVISDILASEGVPLPGRKSAEPKADNNQQTIQPPVDTPVTHPIAEPKPQRVTAPPASKAKSAFAVFGDRADQIVSALPSEPTEEMLTLTRKLLGELAADAICAALGAGEYAKC